MNTSLFIAKRLFTAKENNNNYTRPIIRIAILAIALSMTVMLLSIAIVTGFKQQIRDKVIGFGSHIQITAYTDNQSYETEPISILQDFYPDITNDEGIKHIQVYATKAGIVKTKDEIHGVVLKGISDDYDWQFFKENMVSGDIFNIDDSLISEQILISESISKTLRLNVDDNFVIYFVQNPPMVRKFTISGIYSTELEEFDKLYILGDIKHIQKLNNWDKTEIGGFEITINNFEDLDKQTEIIYKKIGYDLFAQNIKEKNPQIFDWLNLQNLNVNVIIILMLIVGGINMITALLILILEQTKLIGILKALGATNWSVRKVFLYNALYLIGKGLFWGNLIGLGIAFLQKYFKLLSLDESTYYMSKVPINLDFFSIISLNFGTLVVCYLILIIPSIIITKITPIKAIKFE